jgi:hypothetical protein
MQLLDHVSFIESSDFVINFPGDIFRSVEVYTGEINLGLLSSIESNELFRLVHIIEYDAVTTAWFEANKFKLLAILH